MKKDECKDALKFLDYLRKANCTKVELGRSRLNKTAFTTYDSKKCHQALDELDKVAAECSDSHGYKN